MAETLTDASKPTADHLNWRDIMRASDDVPAALIAVLDAYFAPFAAIPEADNHPCLNCGKDLLGLSAAVLGGGFQWGLVHGEGRCSACGWPARVHHFIKNADGAEIVAIHNVLLQYHPDMVERRASDAA